jgi:hypothetical protein
MSNSEKRREAMVSDDAGGADREEGVEGKAGKKRTPNAQRSMSNSESISHGWARIFTAKQWPLTSVLGVGCSAFGVFPIIAKVFRMPVPPTVPLFDVASITPFNFP